jgi:hypothetical protein
VKLLGAVALLALLAAGCGSGAGDATVSVYPGATTVAASPHTGITIRGAAADDLDGLKVTGSRSGEHEGELTDHPDGKGAAWKPEKPFTPGEKVTVDTGQKVAGAESGTTSFQIAPRARLPKPPFDEAKAPDDPHVQSFRSAPRLHPPQVDVRVGTEAQGSLFVAPKRGATQQGPMILDPTGELVWFHPLPGDEQVFDFRTQIYGGKPVLTYWQGNVALYRGSGAGHLLDDRYRPVAEVRAGNGYEMDAHEFQLTDRGTALLISYAPTRWDLSKLGGRKDGIVEDNVVQEVDIATGAVLFEWHALGAIPLAESIRPAPTEAGQYHDPFHFNAVAVTPRGDFIISARHTSTIYKVDRETGRILWRLGGKESDFELGPGVEFHLQHDGRPEPGGTLTLFDNVAEDLPAKGRRSRGLVLKLDEQAMKATVEQEFKHPGTVLSGTQGSMEQLDDGGAFIGWGGMQPFFTEFDAAGEATFDAAFAAKGVESYRAYEYPWRARGFGQPAAAARRDGDGTAVWASWNGATDVASWRAGGVTVPCTGFETKLRLDDAPASVTVEALDASGRVLGRSEPVAVVD